MTDSADVAALRTFNRIYTARLGLLADGYDSSPFTLSEARVLYELASRTYPTAADLCRELRLDRAQVSRTLRRFRDRGLVEAHADPAHGRLQHLVLTKEGRAAFRSLDSDTAKAVDRLLAELHPLHRARLLTAARAVSDIFNHAEPCVVIRSLRAGDLGQVVARQAIIYDQEYAWNADYEALVARILADYQKEFDPTKDDGWIADIAGVMVGSIFLVRGDDPGSAKLRLLYVEPDARGVGIGRSLVETCIRRAQELGYERLDLWTNTVLTGARHIYERTGFQLIGEMEHRSFGHDLVGQTWSLALPTHNLTP